MRSPIPRIRMVSKRNGGVSSAKNAGIREATGDYVLCVDADDALVPEACERLVRAFQESGADVVTFGATAFHPATAILGWSIA